MSEAADKSRGNMGNDNAFHIEHQEARTSTEMKELAVHREHEQQILASQLEGNENKIRKLRRRLDSRLVLTLAVLYLWAFIDRANLGNVRICSLLPSCYSTDHISG